ncbi:hypothetical protein [Terriglobus albidus]|uniref:hypothetical protein n=1 Tax=Terriglobus albidus TaxID=1592106 RepID=UPI0021DF6E96|nr:hypothetical protein [Terriglobus albidus]
MSPSLIFNLHLVLGYVAWLLCTVAYIHPKLKEMNPVNAQRVIATLHSFRFFGLVFILPGVVGHNLPQGFAPFAAYGDFATGLLAILALLAVRFRIIFWPLVVGFNVVGAIDILVDYYHGVRLNLPAVSGDLGSTYAIVVIYVPLLMITHVISLSLMLRSRKTAGAIVRNAVAS